MAWTARRVNHDYDKARPDRRYVLENGNLELQLRDWDPEDPEQVLFTEDEADKLLEVLCDLDDSDSFDDVLSDDDSARMWWDDDNICPECGQEME